MKVKLYIDIDGVLLKARDPYPAEYAEEFISYIVEHYDCYWLTTHCKGDTTPTINYLSEYFSGSTLEKLKRIKPTMWDTLKTEALDFSSKFIWLDDYIMNAELSVLKEYGRTDSVYKVDLKRENLLEIIETIKHIKNGLYPKTTKGK